MIWEVIGISESRNSQLLYRNYKGKSIVMSISEKKIRPKNSPND